ncbi:MAG: hypothetical protein M3O22_00270 [Pseudomonadota bacterium]|nr:hypothetical protein [Pseudomonadota bacterium]
MNKYTFETLRTKSFDELKAIAVGIGLGISEGEKRQRLLSRIMEVTSQISPERPKEEMAEKARSRQSVFSNTKDGVLEVLHPYLERGLHVTFSDGCFHLRAGQKEDSGTLKQPLAVIVRCAESLMRR